MALSVLASTNTTPVLADRRGRGYARPKSPKLGNFTRVYLAIPRFKDKLPGIDPARANSSPTSNPVLALRGMNSTKLDTGILQSLSPGDQQSDATTTDDDSPARDSILSVDAAGSTRDSTPATSPATPGDSSTKRRSILELLDSPVIANSDNEDIFQQQASGGQATQEKHTAYQNVCYPEATTPVIANPNEPVYLAQLQRAERITIAKLSAQHLWSPFADPFNVTWDTNGDFFLGHYQPIILNPWAPYKPGQIYLKPVSKYSIDVLYRVDKQTQIKIAKAKMDPSYVVDSLLRAIPSPPAYEPIHVFVDLSNIIIGFYNCLKAKRGVSPTERVQAPPFFYEAFATVIERSRPCAKRIVVGSKRPRSSYDDYMIEAEKCGYEMNILQRVAGRKITAAERARATNLFDATAEDTDDYGPWCPPLRHREQGVDEILQMKMLQSIVDAPRPGTMVLATGDAAEAEFSDGFLSNVERALKLGWNVELIGWNRNISSAWRNKTFEEKWETGQFRVIELDNIAEELLGMYLRPGERATL
ncbi:hypothetical protein VP1G_06665 [Cytospora mali]|uniref:NYN domain-containing protein n=1 Tax=Cytospora mali TaxID=578113 RepID=A0A194V6J6_CYTMA|nr:hypothetical protein VP1G_06665 [Valsa mali var. pyri (nom. inval.)]